MKWHANSYLENRVFDSRLVKDNLLDKWSCEGGQYVERKDYRNLVESYVRLDIIIYIFIFFHLKTIILFNSFTSFQILHNFLMSNKLFYILF